MTKDVVLITSGGRTGTAFLGRLLDQLISDCWSEHEPDVWNGVLEHSSWRAIRWFGIYHVILGKFLRRTGMRCVTERYLAGDWSAKRTAAAVRDQRIEFYRDRAASLIVESNLQWFGLLPLLPRVFERYKVLVLVRDPRSWVRSLINYGGHHDEEDRVKRLQLPRLSPVMLRTEGADQWPQMDVFERLCWDWQFITSRLLDASAQDSRIRLERFEDIFESSNGRDRLEDVIDFLTNFGHRRYTYSVPPDILDQRINASRPRRMGSWEDWPDEKKNFLQDMCGPLMTELGYSLENAPDASSPEN